MCLQVRFGLFFCKNLCNRRRNSSKSYLIRFCNNHYQQNKQIIKEELDMREYTIAKQPMQKEDIKFLRIFFDNGDFIAISKKEIQNFEVNLYDKLVPWDDDLCPVAESGFLILSLNTNEHFIYNDVFVCDLKNYNTDRKAYIENRICNESITRICTFNEDNWHKSFLVNTTAKKVKNTLIINFIPLPIRQPCNGSQHSICLTEVKKSITNSIYLDFENCEGFTIYQNEIVDMQIVTETELVWSSHDFCRQIKNGYIVWRPDKEIIWRDVNAWFMIFHKSSTIQNLQKRLLPNKRINDHNICRLYINYNYAGFGLSRRECIEVNDIRDQSVLQELERLEEEENIPNDSYIGGYCEKQYDGTILITFGKNAKKYLNRQPL